MNLGSRPPAPRHTVDWPGPRPIVWAPFAHSVDVVVMTAEGEERRPMRLSGAHDPGYWGADTELEPGTVYGFSVDGGEPLTDPLATCLPGGVRDLSCVSGPVQPPGGWTVEDWQPPAIGEGVLLHLDVARATPEGTFAAAAALLPRIAAAGVQGVELSPICTYDGGTPADGVRLFSVNAHLGGSKGLAAFVDAAHAHGLAVVLTPAYRWGVAPVLGLDAFGPYAVDGRLNLDGSGSRGPRDFLLANAEWWLLHHRVDGLSLDIEAVIDHSSVPFVSSLADTTLELVEDSGRPMTLFIDGPGRSDRLTTALALLLTPGGPDPEAREELRCLTRILTPAKRLPLRSDRLVRKAPQTTARATSLVVGDLTRLPGARQAMPWVPADEVHEPADLDARASTLAFAWLAGNAVVLDTDHVPVDEDTEEARRLLAWNATLAGLRADISGPIALGLELHADEAAVALRRGNHAVVLGWEPGDGSVDLQRLLPGAPGGWEVLAAWSPDTKVAGSTLRITGRTTAVLRARA